MQQVESSLTFVCTWDFPFELQTKSLRSPASQTGAVGWAAGVRQYIHGAENRTGCSWVEAPRCAKSSPHESRRGALWETGAKGGAARRPKRTQRLGPRETGALLVVAGIDAVEIVVAGIAVEGCWLCAEGAGSALWVRHAGVGRWGRGWRRCETMEPVPAPCPCLRRAGVSWVARRGMAGAQAASRWGGARVWRSQRRRSAKNVSPAQPSQPTSVDGSHG